MPLLEGYGLTEGGVVSVNPIGRVKPGSIGKLLPGIEVRMEEDGELLLRSAVNFSGYYKDPAATAAVLHDGWLSTGDIATCDDEGYYYITGRKKELIVASNGKKIYPARIEGLFKKEPLINHVLLIGDRLPYVTALITVTGDPAAAQSIVETHRQEREPPAPVLRADPQIQNPGPRLLHRTRRTDPNHETAPQPRPGKSPRPGDRTLRGARFE